GGIDVQWEPEFSALCEGISRSLQRIAEGILTGKFSTPEFDFQAAIQALDAKAKAALTSLTPTAPVAQIVSAAPAASPLEGVLRSHTILFALETLARELAVAQVATEELLAEDRTRT